MTRRSVFASLILLVIAFIFVGCTGMGLSGQDIADAVVKAIIPALSQIEGLSPEQVAAIASAIREAIAGNLRLPEQGFDWTPLLSSVGVTVTGLLGLNLHRNSTRAVALSGGTQNG